MDTIIHVLLVEDSPSDAFLAQEELAQAMVAGGRFSLVHVETLGAALRLLPERHFDVILLDLSLPDSEGFTTFDRLRLAAGETPIVLLSGQTDEMLAVKAVKAGAQDYVVKGHFEGGLLARVIRYAIERTWAQNERRRLEEQFIQAQKMEVVGHLSAGVAHDFNNILSVIIGYNHLMIEDLASDDPLRPYAGEIQHAAERATALTRQLLVFSRQQALQPVILDLNEVIGSTDKMLRRLINEDIKLVMVLRKDIGRIHADSGYIGQVLMNLVVNARDAMPNGGRLTIETDNVILDENYVSSHPGVAAGTHVVLSVTDTGIGMTDEVKAHLFEAFFTTKAKGRGTGLGLATCHTIIRQSGGHITVQSELGRGTTFKVYFPLVDQPADATEAAPATPLPRGKETLLLVEDDPSVRNLACGVLENMGYNVLRASNGQEGLRVASEHRGPPIDLVITDVVMPEMGGKTMAEWLKSSFPELKIVFTSGYTDDAIAHHGVLDPGVAFLPKPYTPAALTRKVREILEA